MALLIDWHSHHTPPEIAAEFNRFTGRTPHIDQFDSSDFSQRVKEVDRVGLDVQLICQGAGIYADRLAAEQAMEIVRKSNDLIAGRLSPYHDRLFGVIAVSLKNIEGSVKEVERMAGKGFRAVLLYPRANGEFVLDSAEADPLFAKIEALGLPIFLHGSASSNDPSLKRLEDEGAGVNARTLQFLIDTLGEERVVFGSDYCGGLGPLEKALQVITDQPNPAHIKSITERNSRRLLKL